MSSKIISGKPGSGKSYYCVSLLASDLVDWAKYELKHGKPFDRRLLCNIPLNVAEVNEYVSDQVGKTVDMSGYIVQLTNDDFGDPVPNPEFDGKNSQWLFWWDLFPKNALIVIDEVHKYLGAEMDMSFSKENLDNLAKFRNWFAEHRHKGQDVIFLSQDPTNISSQIRKIADKNLEITNAKNINLPFPLSIPGSDIDVVRQAWGFHSQYFTVSTGIYRGNRCTFSKNDVTRHLMDPKIFKLYKTHTLSDVNSDRPELGLGKLGSIWWLIRRHGLHLVLKLIAVIFFFWSMIRILSALPFIIANAFVPDVSALESKTPDKKAESGVTKTDKPEEFFPPGMDANQSRFLQDMESRFRSVKEENERLKESIEAMRESQSSIKAVFPGGVLTADGKRRKVGETVTVNGKEETINVINVKLGLVRFVSGYEIAL